ncbi:MAG: 5-formyltetrahydrofolate cyclo-ligase [Proteobacteria bacterium]|nr:5-formyltetrahydrofolate cyclo-ligase [Pseudomonadota bacterium]MBI3496523.1 5-formyltetrahydrofolate cyclo-ligase [Pseudomonadota bacterium]
MTADLTRATDAPHAAGPDAAKRRLRQLMLTKRAGLSRLEAGGLLVQRFQSLPPLAPGLAVSGFWPIGDEIDVRPLLAALDRRGHPIGLPVVIRRGEPLLFRRWQPGDTLVAARFGLSVPAPEAPQIEPDLLLVPLLAFDRAGYRLGYGGGFYDRTLAQLRRHRRVTSVGVAFAGQEVPEVPRGESDERLDWVVTDAEAIRIGDPPGAHSLLR